MIKKFRVTTKLRQAMKRELSSDPDFDIWKKRAAKGRTPWQNILASRVLPAVRVIKTGKIYIGKRGDWHKDIALRHNIEGYGDYGTDLDVHWQRGYHDPATKKFHRAKDIKLDAAELETPLSRMRKYGVESEILSFGEFLVENFPVSVAADATPEDMENAELINRAKASPPHIENKKKKRKPFQTIDINNPTPQQRKDAEDWWRGCDNAIKPRQKRFAEQINELRIAKLFTVAPSDLPKGEDLKSMTTQYGREEGRKRFAKKWNTGGTTFMQGVVNRYADNVHLTREPLFAHGIRSFISDAAGGKRMSIYDVRPSKTMTFDDMGGNVAMIKDRVPAKYIRKRWNDTKSKWENWNAPASSPQNEETCDGPTGDCMSSAYQYLKKNPDHTLVHALVDINGQRKPHAWTEDKLFNVHDMSQGQNIVMSRNLYYDQLRPSNIQRYDLRQAFRKSCRSGHYGPWEQEN